MARVDAALLLTLVLVSCASQKNPDEEIRGSPNLTLGSQSSWQLRGKIGIRSDQGSANLSFVWDQSPHSYEISLTGILGAMVARLNGDAHEVVLTLPDGSEHHGSNIDALLEDQLGVQLPVSLLQYWVRGVPDPRFTYKLTGEGFYQQGWRVEIQQFGARGPRKIQVRQADVRLRLVALEWVY